MKTKAKVFEGLAIVLTVLVLYFFAPVAGLALLLVLPVVGGVLVYERMFPGERVSADETSEPSDPWTELPDRDDETEWPDVEDPHDEHEPTPIQRYEPIGTDDDDDDGMPIYSKEDKIEILLRGMEVRRAYIAAKALKLYGYTGPIDNERDAACGRPDLTPSEIARLFPRTEVADEGQTR